MIRRFLPAALLLLTVPLSSRAAEPVAEPDLLLEENTFGLLRLDPAELRGEQVLGFLERVVEAMREALEDESDEAARWLTAWLEEQGAALQRWDQLLERFEAAGGRRVTLLVTLELASDTVQGETPPFLYVTVSAEPEADVDALGELLRGLLPGHAVERLQDAERRAGAGGPLLVAAAPAVMERLKIGRTVERPHLATALAAVEAPVQLLLVPADHHRRVVEAMLPTLPRQLGGEPTRILTRGLVWAALGAELEPPRLQLEAAAESADAAEALRSWLEGRVAALLEAIEADGLELPPDARQALGRLPDVRDGRLVLNLEGEELVRHLSTIWVPSLIAAQRQALLTASISNLRHLALAVHVYAEANEGRMPRELEAVRPHARADWRAVNTHPRTGRFPAYAYIRSAERIQDIARPSERMLLYERHDEWPEHGVAAAFADGHVRLLEEEPFRRYLQEAEQAAAER